MPRTLVICHDSEPLNRYTLPRWLASFSDLAGIVVIREPKSRLWKRIKREVQRTGWLRFLDVALFRFYYRLFHAAADEAWERDLQRRLDDRFPPLPPGVRVFETPNPNTPETEAFVKELRPDLILARCKIILNKRIFTQATVGTFVMHPGICPEYRYAHGCFWALVHRDVDNVGMTLLKIDAGVDTGPVYGYYRAQHDELNDSHIVIQNRVVFDNLDALEAKFREILNGTARPIDTTGRKSADWGQPWLTSYFRWKRGARESAKASRS